MNYGAPAPRLLSLDSYFLTEVEKMERDPETGRRVKKMVQEYEYEPEMEQTYRYTHACTCMSVWSYDIHAHERYGCCRDGLD